MIEQIGEVQLYTLEEAKHIFEEQRLQERSLRHYYLKQKFMGFILFVIALAIAIVTLDITPALVLFPSGLFLLFTKSRVLVDYAYLEVEDTD